MATIHSAKENLNDHIYITESPVNIYKYQLVLEKTNSRSYPNKFLYQKKRRSIICLPKYDENYVINILKELLPIKGTLGVYCKDDGIFKAFQNTVMKYFSNSSNMKILRCTKFLKDITCKEKLLDLIKCTHLPKHHRGIEETYMELKDSFYFPNFKLEIHKFINNCIHCYMFNLST